MIIKSPFFSLELVIPLLNSSYLLSKYKELIMKNELKLEYITVLYHILLFADDISWVQEKIYCYFLLIPIISIIKSPNNKKTYEKSEYS